MIEKNNARKHVRTQIPKTWWHHKLPRLEICQSSDKTELVEMLDIFIRNHFAKPNSSQHRNETTACRTDKILKKK